MTREECFNAILGFDSDKRLATGWTIEHTMGCFRFTFQVDEHTLFISSMSNVADLVLESVSSIKMVGYDLYFTDDMGYEFLVM